MRLWCKARLAGCGHGAGHTLWQWQARKAWQQERVSKQQTGLGSLGNCAMDLSSAAAAYLQPENHWNKYQTNE